VVKKNVSVAHSGIGATTSITLNGKSLFWKQIRYDVLPDAYSQVASLVDNIVNKMLWRERSKQDENPEKNHRSEVTEVKL